jgi:RNA polymerase sigma-70 factor (ECF subfamily)
MSRNLFGELEKVHQGHWLAEQFEEKRGHLRAVAYRMLGSLSEADDAVQEAWLRLHRSDGANIENLGGWLTTVVGRVCLDMLRSRNARRENALDDGPAPVTPPTNERDPEQEALLADSVGLALLVVLDRLSPAERLAFVLHDLFAMSFEEIGQILDRTPTAARQLASRARRRVQGGEISKSTPIAQHREVAAAFLSALRNADFEGLIAVLDPDVLVKIDAAGARPGTPTEIRGAANWAKGAIAFASMARSVQLALIDGTVGAILAPQGRLARALRFTYANGKIAGVDIIADPVRLRAMSLVVLPE